MPPKHESELTKVEIGFLNIAARFLAAAAKYSVQPPEQQEEAYVSAKVREELVSINTIYRQFTQTMPVDAENPPNTPRAHPIIEIIGEEWRRAYNAGRMPDWSIFTVHYISKFCLHQRKIQKGWHPDLTSMNLDIYLRNQSGRTLWWVETPALPQGHMDVELNEAPPPSQPKPLLSNARMGKTHAPPASGDVDARHAAQPATHSYGLRGRKRPGDDSTQIASPSDSNTMIEDTEATPLKADGPANESLPRVRISDDSQPPPARRARTDVEPLKAIGNERCGPCDKAGIPICLSQVNIKRLTVACQRCAEKKRECNPGAAWSLPIRDLMISKGIDIGTASLDLELQGQIDTLESKIDYLVLVMNGMADNQGIVPSALRGYFPPPAPRTSPSLSIPSLPSASAQTLSLGVPDTSSNTSTRSSSPIRSPGHW